MRAWRLAGQGGFPGFRNCRLYLQATTSLNHIQLLIGALGQFVPDIGSMLGAQTGGNIFNMLSGAVLGYLGMKGSEGAAQAGAK